MIISSKFTNWQKMSFYNRQFCAKITAFQGEFVFGTLCSSVPFTNRLESLSSLSGFKFIQKGNPFSLSYCESDHCLGGLKFSSKLLK